MRKSHPALHHAGPTPDQFKTLYKARGKCKLCVFLDHNPTPAKYLAEMVASREYTDTALAVFLQMWGLDGAGHGLVKRHFAHCQGGSQ